MKKLLVFLAILILLLPSTVLANDINDRVQIHGDVKILANEIVGGDVVAVMGDVTVDGKVMGDVVAVMGDAIINGEVIGDVVVIGGHVTRSDTSKIYGKVTQIGVGEGIGNMIRNFTRFRPRFNFGGSYVFYSAYKIARFLGTIALAALCVILFPNSVKVVAKAVDMQPGRKVLIGLL
ncbi:MAG: polymer-forming cytoskeletal protein, partial [Thermoanaerobacteraceae bacterium]|nr:polymer-forming cytoskeletal protein [Thermoanaerobacteraceae bacterium]